MMYIELLLLILIVDVADCEVRFNKYRHQSLNEAGLLVYGKPVIGRPPFALDSPNIVQKWIPTH